MDVFKDAQEGLFSQVTHFLPDHSDTTLFLPCLEVSFRIHQGLGCLQKFKRVARSCIAQLVSQDLVTLEESLLRTPLDVTQATALRLYGLQTLADGHVAARLKS